MTGSLVGQIPSQLEFPYLATQIYKGTITPQVISNRAQLAYELPPIALLLHTIYLAN